MKAEYINPFLIATQNIVKNMAQIDLRMTGTTVKTVPTFSKNVVIMLGVTGKLKGTIAIGMDTKLAKQIASNMMGYKVEELDEISKSALRELCNIIVGQVGITFEGMSKRIDITPPALMMGDNISISHQESPLLSIKFSYKNMEMDLDIAIKEDN